MSVLQFGLPLGVAIIRPDVGWVIAALAVTRVVWMLLWLTWFAAFLQQARAFAPFSAQATAIAHQWLDRIERLMQG